VKWEFPATIPDVLDLLGAEIQKLETTKSAHASSYDYFGFAAANWV